MKLTRIYVGLSDRHGMPVQHGMEMLEEQLAKSIQCFTLYPAFGYWQGQKEPCFVVEVIGENPVNLEPFRNFLQLTNQECVLVTEELVSARTVSAD